MWWPPGKVPPQCQCPGTNIALLPRFYYMPTQNVAWFPSIFFSTSCMKIASTIAFSGINVNRFYQSKLIRKFSSLPSPTTSAHALSVLCLCSSLSPECHLSSSKLLQSHFSSRRPSFLRQSISFSACLPFISHFLLHSSQYSHHRFPAIVIFHIFHEYSPFL